MNEGIWINIIDIFWPVGSIYKNTIDDSNSPSYLFGGFWENIGTEIINKQTFNLWYRYA